MMDERAKRASEVYGGNFNCAQAVLCAFRDVTGLDDAAALRLASSFGGGMGGLREVCGALTGAFMVLGFRFGFTEATRENKRAHAGRVDALAARFRERTGAILCRDLLARNEADGSREREAKPCLKFVLAAVEEMAAALADEGGTSTPEGRGS